MYYNRNQFLTIPRFIVGYIPDLLILGGPADGNEAQCAIKHWPKIQVIGVEPREEMIGWQINHGWPISQPLLRWALYDSCGVKEMSFPTESGDPDNWNRCASFMPERSGVKREIPTITIDQLVTLYVSPTVCNVILWLDIEGAELEALRGATELFAAGKVILVNLEILERRTEATRGIEEFMAERNFKLVHEWNHHLGHHDRIYVRK